MMKTKLLVFLSCLALSSAIFACGDCGDSDDCSNESACSCVDPACGAPYSCMSSNSCCSAFGNIAAFDSTPAQDEPEYSYSTTNLFNDYSYNTIPAQPYYSPLRSYKGE